jgi:hypothetical protein
MTFSSDETMMTNDDCTVVGIDGGDDVGSRKEYSSIDVS